MSVNVIVLTKRMDFKTLLQIECKGLTGFSPIIMECSEEVKSLLSLGSDVEVLVIDDPKDSSMLFLSKKEQIKNILVLSDKSFQLQKVTSFPKSAVESLMNHLKTILIPNSNGQESYISIPVDSLIHFTILPCDLYIKISEEKYLKRIPAYEEIDESTVAAFKSKGVTEMHFERKNNRDFSLMLLNNMINKVESNYASEDEQHKATNEVFLTTKEIVQSLGLPLKVVEVCESVMERITTDVQSNKDKFSTYINKVKSTNQNFQLRFIELSCYIATQILDSINDENKYEQIKTVVFASFFCDMSLKESVQLVYRSEESLAGLWVENDKRFIQEHAYRAAEIVSKYKNAPAFASELVKQHHGALDGMGLPSTFPDALHPLSKCLIAAQELAYEILTNPNVPSVEVITSITNKYGGTPLHKPLRLFEDSCKNS